jgi:hypothetical protein
MKPNAPRRVGSGIVIVEFLSWCVTVDGGCGETMRDAPTKENHPSRDRDANRQELIHRDFGSYPPSTRPTPLASPHRQVIISGMILTRQHTHRGIHDGA